MILTTCAACAAPLAHNAPRCVRCWTRYCDSTCQHDHWRRGHKQICKRIHRGGNAEQYNADKKYKEAVAVAVEKCADDTKGQTCYICTQALHWKTKKGLVRGCSCRGTAGFAHVSCLAEQAKILMDEAEENRLGVEALDERWHRWFTCSLCEQKYHSVVRCALGWACWKTYVGRPETDWNRNPAMNLLGNGLDEVNQYEDALVVYEAELATSRRLGTIPEHNMLVSQGNLAIAYENTGRLESAIQMKRDVYFGTLKLYGEENGETLRTANNYVDSLLKQGRFEEGKALLRKMIPVARRVLGERHEHTLNMRWIYARALYADPAATLDDLREGMTLLEETERTARRVLGSAHPFTESVEKTSRKSREVLSAREGARSIREAVEAMTSGLDGKLVLDDATTQGHEGDA